MSLTAADMFCGAGGSSLGAEQAGVELRLALNHWQRAIETHSENFPHADHDCEDVSSLTTAQIRRYPDTDILMASPECTNHSLAKGALRRKPQAASLFDDGPAGDAEQDRSRATMWDVVRFAEQKILKGKPYRAIIVENVVDAFKWGYNDDGGLFEAWRQAMAALGYQSQIVYLNSMFAPPTPQSRDRMYVVFWQKGVKRPNLKFTVPAWCPDCEAIVDGEQTWKKPDQPWGRYGAQYLYGCPACRSVVFPGVMPAATAIDWSIPAPRIGDREKPLADKTRERIRRGLERLGAEPFAIRLLQGIVPKPLTLPFVTMTRRHDLGMVIPVGGNTFERQPGSRADDAATTPLRVIHTTHERGLVVANRENNVPRIADREAGPPILTGGTVGVVALRNHGDVKDADLEAVHTMTAGGFHHAVVMRNNNNKSGDSGSMVTPADEPMRSLTTHCHQSLVIPYNRTGKPAEAAFEPSPTLTTKDRVALLVPPTLRDAEPVKTADVWDDKAIDDCGFRMFDLREIATAMSMDEHHKGGAYVVKGNKREQMAQYGNAVTPPAMRLLVSRLSEVLQ